MLFELPSELIYHIATYLPSASALSHLAQTCRRLYRIISADNWRVYRALLQSAFPGIRTPPIWRDAAQALTARARAIDRHGVVWRFALPPQDVIKIGSHNAVRYDNPTLGYRPAIDSYETWTGDTWGDRREVLAWGAADELIVRIKESGKRKKEQWLVFNDLEMISSYDDICGVHLLKPNYSHQNPDKEHLIVGRVRGDLFHLALSADGKSHEYRQKFLTFGSELDRMDLSDGPEPVIAAHLDNGSIAFYSTATGDAEVEPFTYLRIDGEAVARRQKHSKFLSRERIAVGTGVRTHALSVSTISPDGLSTFREIGSDLLDWEVRAGFSWRANVGAIAPLNPHTIGGGPGDVFLAGWGDRVIRLHDLRSHNAYQAKYRDSTNGDFVYSVHPFGHDRFLVGAASDALVKVFDLRMPSNPYSYQTVNTGAPPAPDGPGDMKRSHFNGTNITANRPRKDFSVFLSHLAPSWPHDRRGNNNPNQKPTRNPTRIYRGPIYALSSPSPSSTTVYAGVVAGVARLDFVSTDDLTGPSSAWYEANLALELDRSKDASLRDQVYELPGYERPDPDDVTSVPKLRKQRPFWSLTEKDAEHERETGWDRRWKPLEENGGWRRRDGT